jgi:hypothetical protein
MPEKASNIKGSRVKPRRFAPLTFPSFSGDKCAVMNSFGRLKQETTLLLSAFKMPYPLLWE